MTREADLELSLLGGRLDGKTLDGVQLAVGNALTIGVEDRDL